MLVMELVIGFVEAALASEELDEARFADPFLPPTPRAKPQTAHQHILRFASGT
jgi:hypothetical protein